MRDREIVGLWEAYLQVHQPKEEVENWVNSLIDEGYDLSEYTWDDMCEMYMKLDEAKSKIPGDDLFSQFYRGKNARKQKGVKTHQPGQNRYLAQQNQKRSAARYAADMGRDRTPSASDYDNHGGGSRNEQADLFDIIKGHLLDEGFADTEEAALAIMTNMSEEWREQILDERTRGEQGMSDSEVSRRRNLGGNTRFNVSSGALGDHGSQGAIQKFHKRKSGLRQAIHKSGRNTRGDTGESGGKGRYEANKDHTDGYPSITKRGQGPG